MAGNILVHKSQPTSGRHFMNNFCPTAIGNSSQIRWNRYCCCAIPGDNLWIRPCWEVKILWVLCLTSLIDAGNIFPSLDPLSYQSNWCRKYFPFLPIPRITLLQLSSKSHKCDLFSQDVQTCSILLESWIHIGLCKRKHLIKQTRYKSCSW